jgi:hypothetical protein
VRKGLKGREAVTPRKKSMQSMGFFSWRDGTPAKPGRRSRMRPNELLVSVLFFGIRCGILFGWIAGFCDFIAVLISVI